MVFPICLVPLHGEFVLLVDTSSVFFQDCERCGCAMQQLLVKMSHMNAACCVLCCHTLHKRYHTTSQRRS